MDCKIYIIIALCCLIPFLITIMQCLCCCCNSDKNCICRNLIALSFKLGVFIATFVFLAYVIGQFVISIAGEDLTNLLNIEYQRAITIVTNDERVAYWIMFISALVALIVLCLLIIKYVVFLIEIILISTKISIYSILLSNNNNSNKDKEDYAIKETSKLIDKLSRYNLPDRLRNLLDDIYEP